MLAQPFQPKHRRLGCTGLDLVSITQSWQMALWYLFQSPVPLRGYWDVQMCECLCCTSQVNAGSPFEASLSATGTVAKCVVAWSMETFHARRGGRKKHD